MKTLIAKTKKPIVEYNKLRKDWILIIRNRMPPIAPETKLKNW